MKKLLLLTVLISNMAFANNFDQTGSGDTTKSAKWDAIKKSMINCGGATKSTNVWAVSTVRPYPGCPDVFEDEEKCTSIVQATSNFTCL